MKLFCVLSLAVGLFMGCSPNENKPNAEAKPDTKTDAKTDAKTDVKADAKPDAKVDAAAKPLTGDAFLAENAKKEGVKTTASGLQYKVMKAGTGETPKLTDTVKVHYHGTLTDGTIFDSSVQRGQPISFPVTGVIQGWVEALQL